MKTKHVVVLPYDIIWEQEFARIQNELLRALHNHVIAIEHVGSTSVKGLAAKPIIDIDIIIADGHFLQIGSYLAAIGYAHEGDLGISGREAFSYTAKEHLMPHHLYVCEESSSELLRHLAFRNWLRSHPSDRDAYGKLKIQLAQRYPHDISSYIDGKTAFICSIYQKCGLPSK